MISECFGQSQACEKSSTFKGFLLSVIVDIECFYNHERVEYNLMIYKESLNVFCRVNNITIAESA